LTVVATLLGSGQTKMDAQRVEESGPRSDGQFVCRAIDLERHGRFARRRNFFATFPNC